MTTSTNYTQIIQRIIASTTINVMNIKHNICDIATYTNMIKIFHSIFFIICIAVFIRIVRMSFDSTEFYRVFLCKQFIFTLFTACFFIFYYFFKNINCFRAIFTNKRNFLFAIPFMKTFNRTKNSRVSSKTCFKFNIAIFAKNFFFRMSRFLRTRDTTKFLSRLVRNKRFFTFFTRFMHENIMFRLLINELVKSYKPITILNRGG